ncbi:MAG: cytochrome c family protein [Acidobacteria bacterium]|jgi:hypothetical protein|nr:cytochrome c family protein [Acidobacteriota bacterium]
MRRALTYAAIVALVLASGAFVSTASAADLPTNVTLEGCGTKQPPVDFDHAKHTERTKCGTCHHTQAELTAESAEEVATCVSCHKDPEEAKTPSCAEMSPKKNPYHIKCMGCHKDEVKKDASLKGKAPTTCKECHVKK